MNTDALAAMRTQLANERTVLAYIRTALAFLATGAGLIHFSSSDAPAIAGWAAVGAGVILAVVGIVRFFQIRRQAR